MNSIDALTHASRADTGKRPMSAAIQTLDLTKRYSEVTAVDSLSLSVREGEIYGFLGRNGAGKTTTIRMILGLIRPTRGTVRVFGVDVGSRRREAVAAVGSLVETATAYPNLTVKENLEIQRRLTGRPLESVERAIKLLRLEEYADRRAGRLSLGNKQRLALARAILPQPRLLVLDEPANALDPAGIVEVRHLLRRLADESGVTMFISSHILAEVAQMVDRIGIIHQGRLIDEIDMRGAQNSSRLNAHVSDSARAVALIREMLSVDEAADLGQGHLTMPCDEVRTSDVARLLVGAGIEVHALCPEREDLEARFLRLTGGEP